MLTKVRESRTHNIKLGADPEFEWWYGSRMVYASQVTSDRNRSHTLGTDGASSTGEMRPHPGDSSDVARHISVLIGKAAKLGRNYSIYAGSGKTVPLGGHIHFSGIPSHPELIAALDRFIAIPLNEVSDTRVRSGRYGSLSEIRSQLHGWEYRSPCSWISHPVIARGVLVTAWLLAEAYTEGYDLEIITWEDLKALAKTTRKHTQAEWDLKLYLKMMARLREKNIKLEQIEVFQAWKKKPRTDEGERSPETELYPALQFSDNGDYNVQSIGSEYSSLLSSNHIQRRYSGSYTVVGAARNRAESLNVFLPSGISFANVEKVVSKVEEVGSRYGYSIGISRWDMGAIGLSYSLREHVRLSAEVLLAVVEALKTTSRSDSTSHGCKHLLDEIEGRV